MLTLLFFYVGSTAINVLLLKSITLAVVNEAYRSALKRDVKIHRNSKRVASVIGNIQNFREANYQHVEKMLIGRGNGSLMVSILGGEHNRHSRNLLLESVIGFEGSSNPVGTLGFGGQSTLALRKNSENDRLSIAEPILELSSKSETNSGYRAHKLEQLKRDQDKRLRSGSKRYSYEVILMDTTNHVVVGAYRLIVFASRIVIIVSPVIVLDLYSFDGPIYFVNLLASVILLGKCIWMTKLQGRF
jgi:hypothetical protein